MKRNCSLCKQKWLFDPSGLCEGWGLLEGWTHSRCCRGLCLSSCSRWSLLKLLRALWGSASHAGSFVGADLEMPVRVLEAREKVEQIDGAQFFNPAAVVPMSGWLWALCSLLWDWPWVQWREKHSRQKCLCFSDKGRSFLKLLVMAQLTSVPLWIYTNHRQKLDASFCFSVEILILLRSSVILLKSNHDWDKWWWMVKTIELLYLNFLADLTQYESQKGVGGSAGAEQGQPLPPPLPAQVSLPLMNHLTISPPCSAHSCCWWWCLLVMTLLSRLLAFPER